MFGCRSSRQHSARTVVMKRIAYDAVLMDEAEK